MGKRGPRPAPTGLRLVKGERASRLNTDEPQPKEGLPACPDEATDEVREIWNYTVAQLDHMNLVSAADRDALYAYCEAVYLHRYASHAIKQEGILVPGPHGSLCKNPAVQVQRESASLIRAFSQEFGLTPSARSSVKLAVNTTANKEAGAARLLSG